MKKHLTRQTPPPGTLAQTFLFEFGTGEEIYAVSFKGMIPEPEIRCLLGNTHKHLFQTCEEAIHSYLDTHGLDYSDFVTRKIRPEHHAVMAYADSLLHDGTSQCMDQWIGCADVYYGIMDYQRQTRKDFYEGYYFAVSRTCAGCTPPYKYHVTGQTFWYDSASSSEGSYFAIRKSENGRQLYTLAEEDSQPVLATFGCVDMLCLLIHLKTVTTKQQAADLANR